MAPTVSVDRDGLRLDGQPFYLLAGCVHYFRWPRAEWRALLRQARWFGLNTIDTVIPWNRHAPTADSFDFAEEADLAAYLDLCHELGLKVIVRPGPYICAEWENGGLPAWLTAAPGLRLRTDDERYMAAVGRWFDTLMPLIAPRQHTHGGPVILCQIENEHWASGVYAHDAHQASLANAAIARGIVVPQYTCMGATPTWPEFRNGWSGLAEKLVQTRALWPENPLLVSELWSGWFDCWGASRQTRKSAAKLDLTLHQLAAIGCAGFSHWMWAGGSNFGFWGGRTVGGDSVSMTASYDYDAPISAYGAARAKALVARRHHLFLSSLGAVLAPVLADATPGGLRVIAPAPVRGRSEGGAAPYRTVQAGPNAPVAWRDFQATFLHNPGLDGATYEVFLHAPARHLTVEVEPTAIRPIFANMPLGEFVRLVCHSGRLLGFWLGAATERQVLYHEAHEGHEGRIAADDAPCPTQTTAQPDGNFQEAVLVHVGGNTRQVLYHEAHEGHEGRIAADDAPCPTQTTAQPDGNFQEAVLVVYGQPGEVGSLELAFDERGRGDAGTRGRGDKGTGRRGDKGTRRQRDNGGWRLIRQPVPPNLTVSADGPNLALRYWITETPTQFSAQAGDYSLTVLLLTEAQAERFELVALTPLPPLPLRGEGESSYGVLMPSPPSPVQGEGGRGGEGDRVFPLTRLAVAEASAEAGWLPLDAPVAMERLGNALGYGWYRATLELDAPLVTRLAAPWLSDRARVLRDGTDIGWLGVGPTGPAYTLPISLGPGRHELRLLADNLGRFNYGLKLGELKGLCDTLYLDGEQADLSGGWAALWQEVEFAGEAVANAWPGAFRPDAANVHLGHFAFAGPTVWLLRTVEARPGRRYLVHLSGDRSAGGFFVNGQAVERFSRHRSGGLIKADISDLLRPGPNLLALNLQGYAGATWRATLVSYDPTRPLPARWSFRPGVTPDVASAEGAVPDAGMAFYRANFALTDLPAQSAWLKLRLPGLHKGQIWLNGRNVARFWQIGPQEDYKLPLSWLLAQNELLIFAEEGSADQVTLSHGS